MRVADLSERDFGATLKRAREARGITLQRIATVTKIAAAAFEALERNDLSRLPSGIFGRAIVRSYAIEVGLDPEETVRDFIATFPHDSVTAGSPHVPYEDHELVESNRRAATTAVQLAVASLVIAGLILYMTNRAG